MLRRFFCNLEKPLASPQLKKARKLKNVFPVTLSKYHIPFTPQDEKDMLESIGLQSVKQLAKKVFPKDARHYN